MKTAKGSTYAGLLDFEVTDTAMVVRINLQANLLGDITAKMIADAIPFISERIQSERKPGATFEKELNRIEIHRNQLSTAYMSLIESYLYASQPQKRTSNGAIAATTAQREMLTSMPDKMLREFAKLYISDAAQEYLLPDEKDTMIAAVLAAMKVKE